MRNRIIHGYDSVDDELLWQTIQRHHLSAAKVLVPGDKKLQEMDKVMSLLLDKIIVNNLESPTLASLRDGLNYDL